MLSLSASLSLEFSWLKKKFRVQFGLVSCCSEVVTFGIRAGSHSQEPGSHLPVTKFGNHMIDHSAKLSHLPVSTALSKRTPCIAHFSKFPCVGRGQPTPCWISLNIFTKLEGILMPFGTEKNKDPLLGLDHGKDPLDSATLPSYIFWMRLALAIALLVRLLPYLWFWIFRSRCY